MKRIRVDFVAYRSVVIAVNDESEAIEYAEDYLRRKEPDMGWEYDQRSELEEVSDEAVNEYDIHVCPYCQKEYADPGIDRVCPHCLRCEDDEEEADK